MALQPLNTSNSLGTNFNQVNDIVSQLNNEQTTKVFKDNTGLRRVLMGKGANNFYGLKVSKDGVDVYTATDDQLVFNSSQDVFKITDIKKFSVFFAPNSTSTYTVPHGKTYTPTVISYLKTGVGFFPLPAEVSSTRDDVAGHWYTNAYIEIYVDAVNLYVRGFNALSTSVPVTGSYTVWAYLMQETAGV